MDYKNSLNLPQTDLQMRARLPEQEPKTIAKWEAMNLYGKMLERNRQKPIFALHDGPPYANGHLHHGHVLNKVLKDVVVRYQSMTGHLTTYIPGWDCHGLPIEQQVLQSYKEKGRNFHEVPVTEIREACRNYARRYVDIQREEFKRVLVVGDWDHPYITMDKQYEGAIARELARWIEKGHLYKGFKPVLWDPVFETALAEAEIEYEEHESPSVYVKFPLVGDLAAFVPAAQGKPAFTVIWTTTPWTLPANLAIAFGPHIDYCALEHGGEVYIMASDLVGPAMKDIGWSADSYRILGGVTAEQLLTFKSRHPWIDRDSVHIPADYVTLEQGTGCVHTAPGHGEEDYVAGRTFGIDIYAPVDKAGCFTPEVEKYAGMFVFDANDIIVKDMKDMGVLLNPVGQKITHQYPHSWRSKKPVIFRATEQWFFKLDHNDLRTKALNAIEQTKWVPPWGEARIHGMVEKRPDWCVSRQRAWGVPLPVFRCAACQQDIVDGAVAHHVADLITQHNADIWFSWDEKDLLPEGFTCPHCGASSFEKSTHIVDVWFDSGVSWAAVCEPDPTLGMPVDLYLEGSDQHRGWFNSSLLCGVATRGHAPYKAVLTHGFVVDEKGYKFSKSSRNYVPIEQTIEKQGAEILRLWVVGEDYRNDIRFSDQILSRLVDAYRKLRNTFRFLVGNLYDYDPDRDRVAEADLTGMDRFVLMRLNRLVGRIDKAYLDYELHIIYHSIVDFCISDLSAFYLDIVKDRLYVEAADSITRRAAQQVLFTIASVMSRLLAPVLPHTTEEVWDALPAWKDKAQSVHLTDFPNGEGLEPDPSFMDSWTTLMEVRQEVLKKLEVRRRDKEIGHSLDAEVLLYAAPESLKTLLKITGEQGLGELMIVSRVRLVDDPTDMEACDMAGLHVGIQRAQGQKCQRCWMYHPETGKDQTYPGTCPRCAAVCHQLGLSSDEE